MSAASAPSPVIGTDALKDAARRLAAGDPLGQPWRDALAGRAAGFVPGAGGGPLAGFGGPVVTGVFGCPPTGPSAPALPDWTSGGCSPGGQSGPGLTDLLSEAGRGLAAALPGMLMDRLWAADGAASAGEAAADALATKLAGQLQAAGFDPAAVAARLDAWLNGVRSGANVPVAWGTKSASTVTLNGSYFAVRATDPAEIIGPADEGHVLEGNPTVLAGDLPLSGEGHLTRGAKGTHAGIYEVSSNVLMGEASVTLRAAEGETAEEGGGGAEGRAAADSSADQADDPAGDDADPSEQEEGDSAGGGEGRNAESPDEIDLELEAIDELKAEADAALAREEITPDEHAVYVKGLSEHEDELLARAGEADAGPARQPGERPPPPRRPAEPSGTGGAAGQGPAQPPDRLPPPARLPHPDPSGGADQGSRPAAPGPRVPAQAGPAPPPPPRRRQKKVHSPLTLEDAIDLVDRGLTVAGHISTAATVLDGIGLLGKAGVAIARKVLQKAGAAALRLLGKKSWKEVREEIRDQIRKKVTDRLKRKKATGSTAKAQGASPPTPETGGGAAGGGVRGGDRKTGRGKNRLEPYTDDKGKPADAKHSVFERDQKGNVYKYETYEKTRTGHWDPKKRYDGGQPDGTPGAPHRNKKTGEDVPTPHVQGKDIPGGVRTPDADEIPGKYSD